MLCFHTEQLEVRTLRYSQHAQQAVNWKGEELEELQSESQFWLDNIWRDRHHENNGDEGGE